MIPDFRKQGITTRMFEVLLEVLRPRGVRQYLLEVIKTNTPAYNLYLKQGFAVNREFDCYRAKKESIMMQADMQTCGEIRYFHGDFITEKGIAEPMWDFHPSWQNSLDSIDAIRG